MRFEHNSSNPKFIRLLLENDEMCDLMHDIQEVLNLDPPSPEVNATITFIKSTWIPGKSYELYPCSVKMMKELTDFIGGVPRLKGGDFTSTTKILIQFSEHAFRRFTSFEFFERTMESLT